jgi:hypothetical protein
VYDLPFGHGQRFMSDATGAADKIVSGWGIDGITTFQRGFPLKFTYAGSTPLEGLGLGIANIRPNVVTGCSKKSHSLPSIDEFFNTSCFVLPPAYGYGNEARVDSNLRAPGINNWDLAIFKRTQFGPDNRLGLEFRTEFFNTFNRVQFGFPGTALSATGDTTPGTADTNNNGFGVISSQNNNPRLIQFALKFLF